MKKSLFVFVIIMFLSLTDLIYGQAKLKSSADQTKSVCELSFVPGFKIVNEGTSALESISFSVLVDGKEKENLEWTGVLEQDSSTTVTLPTHYVYEGIHTIQIYLDESESKLNPHFLELSWTDDFEYSGCTESASFVWGIQTSNASLSRSSVEAFEKEGKKLEVANGGVPLTCPNCKAPASTAELNLWTHLVRSDESRPETNVSFDRGENWSKALWVPGKLQTQEDSTIYLATMEKEFSAFEEMLFSDIKRNRIVFQNANITQDQLIETNEVARLGGASGTVGPSKLLKLKKGESLKAETYIYLTEGQKKTSNAIPIIPAILASLQGNLSALELRSPGGIGLNPSTSLASAFFADKSKTESGAGIGYVLFNDDLEVIDIGFEAVGERVTVAPILLELPKMEFKFSGFIYLFLSNDESSMAFFDDFRITHYSKKKN